MWTLYSDSRRKERLRAQLNEKNFAVLVDIKKYNPFEILNKFEEDESDEQSLQLIYKASVFVSNIAVRLCDQIGSGCDATLLEDVLSYNIFGLINEYHAKITNICKNALEDSVRTKCRNAWKEIIYKLAYTLNVLSRSDKEIKLRRDILERTYKIGDIEVPSYRTMESKLRALLQESIRLYSKLTKNLPIIKREGTQYASDDITDEEFMSIVAYHNYLLEEDDSNLYAQIDNLKEHLSSIETTNFNVENIRKIVAEIFNERYTDVDVHLKTHLGSIDTSLYRRAKENNLLTQEEGEYNSADNIKYISDSTIEYYSFNLTIDLVLSKLSRTYANDKRLWNNINSIVSNVIEAANAVRVSICDKAIKAMDMIEYLGQKGSSANTVLNIDSIIAKFEEDIIKIENTKYVHSRTGSERYKELFERSNDLIKTIYFLFAQSDYQDPNNLEILKSLTTYQVVSRVVDPVQKHFSNFSDKIVIRKFLSDFPLTELAFFSSVIRKLYGAEPTTTRGLLRRAMSRSRSEPYVDLKEVLRSILSFLIDAERTLYRMANMIFTFYIDCIAKGYYLVVSDSTEKYNKSELLKRVYIDESKGQNDDDIKSYMHNTLLELTKIVRNWMDGVAKLVNGIVEYGYAFGMYDFTASSICEAVYSLPIKNPDSELYRNLKSWHDLPHLLINTGSKKKIYGVLSPEYMSLYYMEMHLKVIKNIALVLITHQNLHKLKSRRGTPKESKEGINPLIEFLGLMAYLTNFNSLVLKNTGSTLIERNFARSREVQFKKLIQDATLDAQTRTGSNLNHNEVRYNIMIKSRELTNNIEREIDDIKSYINSYVVERVK